MARPAPIRSTQFHWQISLRKPERLLRDLVAYTDLNALEVGSFYSTSDLGIVGPPRQRALVPSLEPFDGIRFSVAPKAESERVFRSLKLAKSSGFKISCGYCPVYIPTTAEMSLGMVDITGAPLVAPTSRPQPMKKPNYLYGCPNNPRVIRFGETMIREIIASWGSTLDMVGYDHVEFPLWPGRRGKDFLLGDLFSCFCPSCKKKAEGLGIDFQRMKKEVSELYRTLTTRRPGTAVLPVDLSPDDLVNFFLERPMIATWLNFRSSSMTECVLRSVKAAREAAQEHNPNLKLGLQFQLPSWAYLLGTDFVELGPHFDYIRVKYPEYLTGNTLPLLADLVASKTGWDNLHLRRLLRELLDFGPGPGTYREIAEPKQDILFSDTFDVGIIDREMRYLAPLEGKVKIYPYLFLPNRNLKLWKQEFDAIKRLGFDGYGLRQYESDLTTEALKETKGMF